MRRPRRAKRNIRRRWSSTPKVRSLRSEVRTASRRMRTRPTRRQCAAEGDVFAGVVVGIEAAGGVERRARAEHEAPRRHAHPSEDVHQRGGEHAHGPAHVAIEYDGATAADRAGIECRDRARAGRAHRSACPHRRSTAACPLRRPRLRCASPRYGGTPRERLVRHAHARHRAVPSVESSSTTMQLVRDAAIARRCMDRIERGADQRCFVVRGNQEGPHAVHSSRHVQQPQRRVIAACAHFHPRFALRCRDWRPLSDNETSPMKRKTISLLILACATGVAFAQQATLTEPQVRAQARSAGLHEGQRREVRGRRVEGRCEERRRQPRRRAPGCEDRRGLSRRAGRQPQRGLRDAPSSRRPATPTSMTSISRTASGTPRPTIRRARTSR